MSNSLNPDDVQHMSGLIWVQTVCKNDQQATLAGKDFRQAYGWRQLVLHKNVVYSIF